MRYPIYVRPDAEVDLEEAAIWYEKQRSRLGGEFLDEIQQTWNTMAENPYLYAAVHRNIRRALTRRFPFGIYYRIEHDFPMHTHSIPAV